MGKGELKVYRGQKTLVGLFREDQGRDVGKNQVGEEGRVYRGGIPFDLMRIGRTMRTL